MKTKISKLDFIFVFVFFLGVLPIIGYCRGIDDLWLFIKLCLLITVILLLYELLFTIQFRINEKYLYASYILLFFLSRQYSIKDIKYVKIYDVLGQYIEKYIQITTKNGKSRKHRYLSITSKSIKELAKMLKSKGIDVEYYSKSKTVPEKL